MTLPFPTDITQWTGPTAVAVRVRPCSGSDAIPAPHGTVTHLGPTGIPRLPMFLLAPARYPVEPLPEDRAAFTEDGQHIVNLVRLSFGGDDMALAVELMPDPRRSIHLEVWCAAEEPANPHAPQEWDHHTIWDVSPMLVRWRHDRGGGNIVVGYWEFIGKVNRPLRAVEPVMVEAAQRHQGELPLFCTRRGNGPIPPAESHQPPWPPIAVWPGPNRALTPVHLDTLD